MTINPGEEFAKVESSQMGAAWRGGFHVASADVATVGFSGMGKEFAELARQAGIAGQEKPGAGWTR